MKCKIVLENGLEIIADISESDICKITGTSIECSRGYSRVLNNEVFYAYSSQTDKIVEMKDNGSDYIDRLYISGNYYSHRYLALNIIRADRLIRQLRRFSNTHSISDKVHSLGGKYTIIYDYEHRTLKCAMCSDDNKLFGCQYFDTAEIGRAAIDEFRDELMWYFEEYIDRL